ncbi:hypothetical protein LUZ60_000893 [Juncus effusus]|nr:hypothetical protein LUZ60_000893 [Juncus effusus]
MLKKLIPSCISTSKRETAPPPRGFPFKRTFHYETHLGKVLLILYHAATGLSIYTELRFSMHNGEEEPQVFSLEINPSLSGQLDGTKKTTLKDGNMDQLCHLTLAWDFSSAEGSFLPTSNYYCCIVSNEEMILLLGDMQQEAYKSTMATKGRDPIMISRVDEVKMEGNSVYNAKEIFGGVEKEISINLSRGLDGPTMSISMDGRRLIDMNNLLKKFRGSFKLDLPGGDMIHVTWDLFKWLLSCENDDNNNNNNNKDKSVNEVQRHNHQSKVSSLVGEGAHGIFTFSFVETLGGNIGSNISNVYQENYVKLLSFEEDISMVKLVREWIGPEDERMKIGHKFSFLIRVWKK